MQKIFSKDQGPDAARRYGPPICTGIKIETVFGRPIPARICTSFIERANLTVRTYVRRFVRLGIGYSKKLRNHRLAVSLFVASYNFVKKHGTLGTSPAVAAKLTDHIWTVEELLANIAPTTPTFDPATN